MGLRTPFSKVTGLGAAHEGTEHFWRQRLTAVSNLPLVMFLIAFGLSATLVVNALLSDRKMSRYRSRDR